MHPPREEGRPIRAVVAYTDLVPGSAEGLRAAARLARDLGSTLHVIHAMDVVGRPLREMVGPLQQGFIQKRRAELIAHVRDAIESEGTAWSAWIDGRDPSRSVADLVRESQAGLVIVAGASPALGPDVWNKVARTADVPVLAIEPPDRTELYWPPRMTAASPLPMRHTCANTPGGRCGTDMMQSLMTRVTREIERLLHELTVDIPAALRENPENAEHEAIVRRQRSIHKRIGLLQKAAAELPRVSPDSIFPDRVGFGSRVEVEDLGSGEKLTYILMAGDSIDLDAGEISIESPVGWALLGARQGEEVVVTTPRGNRRLRIGSVETLFDSPLGSGGGSPEDDSTLEFASVGG